MLKFTRKARKKNNYQLRQVDIDQSTCERVHACVAQFGCPTFTRLDDGSVKINPDLCIGDGSCIQTCPTRAITSPKTIS
jgi:indolepyruvate ferredoxin oxidoreductase alpha subunit